MERDDSGWERSDQAGEPEVLAAGPGATVLAGVDSVDVDEPGRGRRRLVVAGAAVAVLGLGGAAWSVGSALSGGGTQPETVVPASAALYVELDLDPSAGQKVEAFRFLRKFPELRDQLGEDSDFGAVIERLFDGSDVDYATDIEPWLGDRFAFALVPGPDGGWPRVQLVLQTDDEAQARASLERLLTDAEPGQDVSVATADGYAVLAVSLDASLGVGGLDDGNGDDGGSGDTGAATAADLLAEAGRASLAEAPSYVDAVSPYGPGVATVWADGAALQDLVEDVGPAVSLFGGPASLVGPDGVSVAVLRFEGGAAELVGAGPLQTPLSSTPVTDVGSLPDDTYAVLGGADLGAYARDTVAGALESLAGAVPGLPTAISPQPGGFDDEVTELFEKSTDPSLTPAERREVNRELRRALRDLRSQGTGGLLQRDPEELFGPFGDPDGWPTLFGDQTFVALGPGGDSTSQVAVRVVGGPATVRAVERLVDELQPELDSAALVALDPDGVTVASDAEWLQAVTAGGALGQTALFQEAAPDAAGASLVGYVNFDGLLGVAGDDLDEGERATLDALRAFGVTVTVDGGRAEYRLRVTTD